MTDLFDQLITDGLHRAVDGVAVPRGSFSDVRRRVRARRNRSLAAAAVPAVAGMAWLGMRPSAEPAALPPGGVSGSVDDSSNPASTSSSEPTPDTTATSSTEPTTTSIGGSTISPDLVAGVLCLDATRQSDGSLKGCIEHLPGARMMAAPTMIVSNETPRFVVPLDPAYEADAQILSEQLGLPVRSDLLSFLQQDLAGVDLSGVRVLMVIGTTDETVCTLPACTVPGATAGT